MCRYKSTSTVVCSYAIVFVCFSSPSPSRNKMKGVLRLACLSLALSLCVADVYMHNPRGSNNRLNERSANRNNADRLFDSQVRYNPSSSSLRSDFTCMALPFSLKNLIIKKNNNRGGYNAGDTLTANNGFQTEDQIYHMVC